MMGDAMNILDYSFLTRRMSAKWDAYVADREGSAAVEFAMIAMPFFFIIFALIEVSVLFLMSTVLEHATTQASRNIRTGAAQSGNMDITQFRQDICDNLVGLMDCGANLHIDVQSFDNFSTTSLDSPIDDEGKIDDSSFAFEPGEAEQIVTVRIFYEWSLITPIITKPLENLAGGKHMLQSNLVFRNEPFGE